MKKYKVGDKIKFKNQKLTYRIRAIDRKHHYAICVWKCNLPNMSYIYTIVDFREKIRGAHNMIFNCYENSDKGFRGMLADLLKGQIEISKRNFVDLVIDKTTKNT